MIRDVLVWLDGGASDEIRLAAIADMTRQLETRVVIGLYLIVLPLPGSIESDAIAAIIEHARETGNAVILNKSLASHPFRTFLLIVLPSGRCTTSSIP